LFIIFCFFYCAPSNYILTTTTTTTMHRSTLVDASVSVLFATVCLAVALFASPSAAVPCNDIKDALEDYWLSQPVNASATAGRNFSCFFSKLDDDAYFGNTFQSQPYVGKAAIVSIISLISTGLLGYTIRSIDNAVTFQSADGLNGCAQANKTLCGTDTGLCGRNLQYYLIAHANAQGKIYALREGVPPNVIDNILPQNIYDATNPNSLYYMCSLISASCSGANAPDFGLDNQGRPKTCFQHWRNAPTFNPRTYLWDNVGRSTGCVALNLIDIQFGVQPAATGCSKLGASVPGVVGGCW